MANSGSARRSGSGNRRPPGTGNRSAATRRSGAPAVVRPSPGAKATDGSSAEADGSEQLSADQRARERLAQPKPSGKRRPAKGGGRPSQRRADQRKGGPVKRSTAAMAGLLGGVFVALAVVVIVLISLLGGSATTAAGSPILAKPAPANVVKALTGLTAAQFQAAGLGGGQVSPSGVFAATPGQKPITDPGKPVLVYEGAEYCPYCAAARWPLTIALSRFGTFTGLQIVGSSPYDVYANTRTLSFAKAHYTSPYVAFDPIEFESNVCAGALSSGQCAVGYKPLQSATKAQAALMTTYDTEKYFPQDASANATEGWIPFMDWGGLFVSSGALYSAGLINPGTTSWKNPMTWDQIIATFQLPSTGTGQAILGSANVYTAAICDMTHDEPGNVCGTSLIKQAQAELPTA